MQRQRFSRRDMMKLGTAGSGYVLLRADGTLARADSDGYVFQSPATLPWCDELRVPADPIVASASQLVIIRGG